MYLVSVIEGRDHVPGGELLPGGGGGEVVGPKQHFN